MGKSAGKAQGKVGRGRPPEEHQFKPGQSGNPKGNPKGTVSLVAALRRRLRDNPDELEDIVENLAKMAAGNDAKALKAIQTIMDRMDGPVARRIEGADGGPIKIDLTY